jgi:hypothetical protein
MKTEQEVRECIEILDKRINMPCNCQTIADKIECASRTDQLALVKKFYVWLVDDDKDIQEFFDDMKKEPKVITCEEFMEKLKTQKPSKADRETQRSMTKHYNDCEKCHEFVEEKVKGRANQTEKIVDLLFTLLTGKS